MDELLTETRETLAANVKLKKDLLEIADACAESLATKGPSASMLMKLKNEKEQSAILLEQNISLKASIQELEISMQEVLTKYRSDADLCTQARKAARSALDDLQDARSHQSIAEEALEHAKRELVSTKAHNERLVREVADLRHDETMNSEKFETVRRELTEKVKLLEGNEVQQVKDRKEAIRFQSTFESLNSESRRLLALNAQLNSELCKMNTENVKLSAVLEIVEKRLKIVTDENVSITGKLELANSELDAAVSQMERLRSLEKSAAAELEREKTQKQKLVISMATHAAEVEAAVEGRYRQRQAELERHNESLIEELTTLRLQAEQMTREEQSNTRRQEAAAATIRREVQHLREEMQSAESHRRKIETENYALKLKAQLI